MSIEPGQAVAVISVHAIRGGGAAGEYYLGATSACEGQLKQAAGYYADGHDTPGRWLGRGALAMGLEGGLDPTGQRRFTELLAGRVHGGQVARPVMRRATAVGQATDQPAAEVRDVRVAAYDVTFSAPKSVSTLLALTTAGTNDEIHLAHDRAVREAMRLLEQLSARAARGHHGDGLSAPRIATDGLIAAAFDHTTSRALDPQVHTHVVVMNLVRAVDGRWSALDSRTLHRQATTASYLYQHLLRAELTRILGVRWGPVERGVAEIEGIGKEVRREFSTRRTQIEASLSRNVAVGRGGVPRRAKTLAAKAACLATRPAKRHVDPKTLRESWIARGTAKGFGPAQADQLLATRHTGGEVDRGQIADRVLSEHGVTRERPIFDQGTVLRELISALPPGADLSREQLVGWTNDLLSSDSVVPLDNVEPGRAHRQYTTVGMLAAEDHVLALAARATAEPFAVVPVAELIPALARSGLRPEQRDLAQILLLSGRAVEIVSGPAGSGKTHALCEAVTAWSRHGLTVRGTAVAALTAQGLQDATGAESVSLTRLLNQPDRHLPREGVLLVDEAGMIGTHQLHRLLTAAQRRDCKVVLVGDPAQLPEIEAGGSFAALTRQPAALHLDGHGRQTEAWEQRALHDLRRGNPTALLDAYQAHDRLHLTPSRDELHATLVTDYLHARKQQRDPWQVAVLAARRSDVTLINQLIRQQLTVNGTLGRRGMTVITPEGPVEYRKGDQVLVTRNHHDRQLLNGSRGTVRTIRRDGLVLDLTDGRRVTVGKAWLAGGDLDHGYAITLHKAQGRTVHTSLVLADESLGQEGAYVGLSRGTSSNHLYLDTATEHALRDCGHSHVTVRPAPPQRPDRALTRSTRQSLANDCLPAGHGLAEGRER